jgi:hypothetical protein
VIDWEVTEGMQLLLCFKNHFRRITMQKESGLLALHSYKHRPYKLWDVRDGMHRRHLLRAALQH